MAFHVRIRNDVRGTRGAVNEGHLAEAHAGRKAREPLLLAARQIDAHQAARQEKHFPCLIAGADDFLAAPKGMALQQGPDDFQFLRGEPAQQLVIRDLPHCPFGR